MNKKLIALMLCLCVPFAAVSCGEDEEEAGGKGGKEKIEDTVEDKTAENGLKAESDAFTVKLAPENAPENACGDNATWRYDEESKTLYIEGKGAMWDYVDFENDFEKNEDSAEMVERPWEDLDIETLNVKNGITTVGNLAFSWEDELNTVILPDGLKKIGDNTFAQTGITNIQIPDTVEYIGAWAFAYCDKLQSVSIPEGVTAIMRQAFSHCEALESVKLPDSLESIDYEAFSPCEALKTVEIPMNVSKIDKSAFGYCLELESIGVDGDNQNYSSEDGVLMSKDKTALIFYPAGKQGKDYTVPETVTRIEENAFATSAPLETVTLPAGVSEINSTFDGKYLKAIYVDDNNPYFCDNDGILMSKDKTVLIRCPRKKSANNPVPVTVTEIAPFAFYYCEYLGNVKFEGDIKFGEGAFSGAEADSIHFMGKVEGIDDYTFRNVTTDGFYYHGTEADFKADTALYEVFKDSSKFNIMQ